MPILAEEFDLNSTTVKRLVPGDVIIPYTELSYLEDGNAVYRTSSGAVVVKELPMRGFYGWLFVGVVNTDERSMIVVLPIDVENRLESPVCKIGLPCRREGGIECVTLSFYDDVPAKSKGVG